MTASLRRERPHKEDDRESADDRDENHQSAPRRRRCVDIGVVDRGELTEEKQIVHDGDQPAKQDRAETGHRADKNGNDRKYEEVHRTFGRIDIVHVGLFLARVGEVFGRATAPPSGQHFVACAAAAASRLIRGNSDYSQSMH